MCISSIQKSQRKQHLYHLIVLLSVFTLCSVFIYDITHLALKHYYKYRGVDHLVDNLKTSKNSNQSWYVNNKIENVSFRIHRFVHNYFLKTRLTFAVTSYVKKIANWYYEHIPHKTQKCKGIHLTFKLTFWISIVYILQI